jgi:TonB-linked SusC/RagA family outer membrane protein
MNLNFYQFKQHGRHLCALFLALLLAGGAWAAPADVTISGRVTNSDDGSALPGVNIVVKGTQNGTITDSDGKYSISAAENAMLVFSYIGYNTQEVAVNGRMTVDLALQPNMETLNEVVVTALGIKREERSLGYSVGQVKGSDMTRVPQENVLNGLAGRMPGVSVSSTGGVGSSVNLVIRGAKSLSTDNQPLFVVDGVPVNNTVNNVTRIGRDNNVDYGNAISDINPEDVESVSVLKGPSAAALYGSRAGNGVVLITTKSGSASKKMTVSISSNTTFDVPYKFIDMHSKYAIGTFSWKPDFNPYPGGVLQVEENSAGALGPELDKGYKAVQWNSPLDANGDPIPTDLVSHPDNVKNFVKTGVTSTNSISISNSSDMVTYRLSYTNMKNSGVIPNSDLLRNSLTLNTSVKVHEKFRLSSSLDFTKSGADNRPAGNRGTNPMQWAYAVGPHIDIRDLKDYWVKGQEGLQQRAQDLNFDGGGEYNNPYFIAYEVNNGFTRNRLFGNLKGEWQITPEFNVTAKYAMDTYTEQRETKIGASYTGEARGAYGIVDMRWFERNADILATYKKTIQDFHITLSAGGNLMSQDWGNVSNSSKDGAGLIVPGLYTIQNIPSTGLNYSNYRYRKAINSVYGLANFGYKDMVYLDVTARNDWSSTLPASNRSYFYPSASLSVLVNEIADLGPSANLVKLRAGIAQAGNDTQPYQLANIMGNGAWGGMTTLFEPSNLLIPDLKPEISTSKELGLDLGFFNNRLRFEGTYYTVDNKNQIFNTGLAPSSGYESKKINAGLLTSKGWEFMIGGTPFERGDWRWDVNVNFSRNTTTIERLSDGLTNFTLWTDAKGGARTYVGDRIGDIYDAKLVTVEDKESPYYGYPILDENGSWQAVDYNSTKNKIGNFNPDFLMGLQSTINYKAFTLNLSFDWRKGGDFVSQTYRYGESDMRTQRWLDLAINPPAGVEFGTQAFRDWIVANQGTTVTDGINVVGNPIQGFPFEVDGFGTLPYGGVFNPGVIAEYDGDGNIVGYVENLGNAGTKTIPFADDYAWDFTKTAMFDASFIKLREVSLGYALPTVFIHSIGLKNASVSLYARNIMLWTAAKIGVDPELAYQPDSTPQNSGIQFKQGIERYNVTPWTISTGFKVNLTF